MMKQNPTPKTSQYPNIKQPKTKPLKWKGH